MKDYNELDWWTENWLAIFQAKKLQIPLDKIPRNRNCKNCGVTLLKAHIGQNLCGDCKGIPPEERDGFYAHAY